MAPKQVSKATRWIVDGEACRSDASWHYVTWSGKAYGEQNALKQAMDRVLDAGNIFIRNMKARQVK